LDFVSAHWQVYAVRFQVISHAGLLVESRGISLLMDPWILGSAYWRSWWNYPPVRRTLQESLTPDYIYLTHVHWDHFHSPSLHRFGRDQQILIPRAPDTRMWRDLKRLGFRKVTELAHSASVDLGPGFRITSYQFNLFMDSALVVEAEGVTLFNVNDAKFMGKPLGQIMRRHGPIDFMFRSHSSANARACYEILDDPAEGVDEPERYVRDFADFAVACGCRYAIPFASNHCHLHKDVFHFNSLVRTPQHVVDYFKRNRIETPAVKIMVSGDSWSSGIGFDTPANDFFENRDTHLQTYAALNRDTLEGFYAKEARTSVTCEQMEKYFSRFAQAIPWIVRRRFKNQPICYVLSAGERRILFEVNVYHGTVRELDCVDDRSQPIQIHTSAFILRQCMAVDLFGHLTISKRVRYRVTSACKKYVVLLNLMFKAYEYEMLPLRRLWSRRFIGVWLSRWREFSLYSRIALDFACRRKFEASRYLPAPGVRPWSRAAP
jgi:UDP-MurNAc hydroxylase